MSFAEFSSSLVWVFDPLTRVYRADDTLVKLGENDQLSGEDVLSGFSCGVSELFEVPGGQTSQ